jgi:hypothetical protein
VFQCRFTRIEGMPVTANVNVSKLDAAIARALKMLHDELDIDDFIGVEIWQGQLLLYQSAA